MLQLKPTCFRLDWANAKALISGFTKGGQKIHQVMYCFTRKPDFPALITYNRAKARFEHSTIGENLNNDRNLPPLKFIADLEATYQIKNDMALWEIVCKNGLFDIWKPEAPFERFQESKSNTFYIGLLRIYEINETFTLGKDVIESKNLRNPPSIVANKKDVNILKPVVPDEEFNRLRQLLETSIAPFRKGKTDHSVPQQNRNNVVVTTLETSYKYKKYFDASSLDLETFEKYLQLIENKKQVIFQGAPGTGKSYLAQIFTNLLTDSEPFASSDQYEVIQFHPSYSYEDFIQGYRPITEGGFKLTEGIFLKISDVARKSEDGLKFVLFIDEINRGNLSKIFGEVLYLLEYRDKTIKLTYSPDTEFSIPENLYIIGTMNTADRSLAMVDYALRRRFDFINLKPDYEIMTNLLMSNGCEDAFASQLADNLKKVNQIISDNHSLGSGFEIGHSYFVKEKNFDISTLEDVWEFKLLPLLEEYFYDNQEEIDSIHKELFRNL